MFSLEDSFCAKNHAPNRMPCSAAERISHYFRKMIIGMNLKDPFLTYGLGVKEMKAIIFQNVA
jgi:hypothetical protein